jgi:hypothetical protein
MRNPIIFFLLMLLPLALPADERRILISGFSLHEHPRNQFGEPYNAFSAGAGYEYNFFDDFGKPYFSANLLLIKDSFYNPQLTLGFGHAVRFHQHYADTALGLSGFIGWKKLYDRDDRTKESGAYGVTGGIAPALSFYRGDLSVNFIYVPSVEIAGHDITGFLFGYFGWKF